MRINLLGDAERGRNSLAYPRGDQDCLADDKCDTIEKIDVAVIGAGIAGMAASIHLARVGMRVVCIEADAGGTEPVGESLDWSAPDLLAALGLPMRQLLDEGIATFKRHITLKLLDGTQHEIRTARPTLT